MRSATDHAKREIFDNLHKHFNQLVDEVEQAVKPKAPETAEVGGCSST
jgi:hypothetical protein